MAREKFDPTKGAPDALSQFMAANVKPVAIPPPAPSVAEAMRQRGGRVILPGDEVAGQIEANGGLVEADGLDVDDLLPNMEAEVGSNNEEVETNQVSAVIVPAAAAPASPVTEDGAPSEGSIPAADTSPTTSEAPTTASSPETKGTPDTAPANGPETSGSTEPVKRPRGRQRVNDEDAEMMTIRVPREIYEWIENTKNAVRKARLGKPSWNVVNNDLLALAYEIKNHGGVDVDTQVATPNELYLAERQLVADIAAADSKNAAAQIAREFWRSKHPDQPGETSVDK